jgi:hypothetical protein
VRGRRKEKKRTVHFPLIGGVVGNFYQLHEIRFVGASLEVLRGFDGSGSLIHIFDRFGVHGARAFG